MDARTVSPFLYEVHFRGPPEVFSARRAELEEAVRHALDAPYGGHAAAAGVLHALVDSLDLDECETSWSEALRAVVDHLGVRLPPGARFECELTAEATESRVT